MDKIYKADPEITPYVTEKLFIKDVAARLQEAGKSIPVNLLNIKKRFGPDKLDLDAFIEGLNYSDDEYPPIEDVDPSLLKLKPNSFLKPEFTTAESRKVADDFIAVGHAKRTIELENAALHHNGRRRVSGQRLKYSGIRWLEDGKGSATDATQEPSDLVPLEDYSVSVRVYHPFRHILGSKNPERPKLCQEVVVLGNQTLADLRSMILCSTDMGVPKDMSLDPLAPVSERAWDVYKSGFIFINNTFYNDFQDPSNIDYSAVIRDWAEKRGIGPFRTGDIELVRIADLELQLGYPYVYQHQGDCEHLVVFSDITLLDASQSLVSKNYPYVKTAPMRRARYCMVCGNFMAKWVTRGLSRAPVDPCYFCETCFYKFNYIDGKKLGNFKAFPYIDRSALV